MRSLLIIISICCLIGFIEAKRFTRCELAKELKKRGLDPKELPNWVCLVENESGRDTAKINKRNKNGSWDHGLFQINDKYWCTRKGPAGLDCHVTCPDVSKPDITKAVECAKKVKKRHGFYAWYGWRSHCKNKPLPDLSKCF